MNRYNIPTAPVLIPLGGSPCHPPGHVTRDKGSRDNVTGGKDWFDVEAGMLGLSPSLSETASRRELCPGSTAVARHLSADRYLAEAPRWREWSDLI